MHCAPATLPEKQGCLCCPKGQAACTLDVLKHHTIPLSARQCAAQAGCRTEPILAAALPVCSHPMTTVHICCASSCAASAAAAPRQSSEAPSTRSMWGAPLLHSACMSGDGVLVERRRQAQQAADAERELDLPHNHCAARTGGSCCRVACHIRSCWHAQSCEFTCMPWEKPTVTGASQ